MATTDLDSLPWYTKRQVAEHQLDCAIRLLLDECDAISATTLAGAAEEILGKLVTLQGKKHSLDGFIDLCVSLGAPGERASRKEFANIANDFRNQLKHYSHGSDIAVTPEMACELIDRAAENLWLLDGGETEQVMRYLTWRHRQ